MSVGRIVESAVENIIREKCGSAINDLFNDPRGYSSQPIRDGIVTAARECVANDPEIKAIIRQKVIEYLTLPTTKTEKK